MAIHKSAKKRIRRNTKVQARNKSRKSEMRTYVRKVEEAITTGDAAAAADALKAAQPKLSRSADKGLLHKKTAARKISRLSKKIATLKKK